MIQKSASPPASLILRTESYGERLQPARFFPKEQPLEVELGSGDGSFLIEWARRNPSHNFIGVERFLGRIRKFDRNGLRGGLINLRGIRLEASYFLEYLLPPASVVALHVYFPDPWPKRKHRKHRLINTRFAEVAVTILASAGIVYLRTDDADYAAQMGSIFKSNPRFRAVETPAELREVHTDFEKTFQSRGVVTLRQAYRLEAESI